MLKTKIFIFRNNYKDFEMSLTEIIGFDESPFHALKFHRPVIKYVYLRAFGLKI